MEKMKTGRHYERVYSGTTLRQLLGLSKNNFNKLLEESMPYEKLNGRKVFNLAAVFKWLLSKTILVMNIEELPVLAKGNSRGTAEKHKCLAGRIILKDASDGDLKIKELEINSDDSAGLMRLLSVRNGVEKTIDGMDVLSHDIYQFCPACAAWHDWNRFMMELGRSAGIPNIQNLKKCYRCGHMIKENSVYRTIKILDMWTCECCHPNGGGKEIKKKDRNGLFELCADMFPILPNQRYEEMDRAAEANKGL